MADKYTYPEEEPQMVNEPPVALQYSSHTQFRIPMNDMDADFNSVDAPCQFGLEEVKEILLKNRDDFRKGHYHTMADVNRLMDNWC